MEYKGTKGIYDREDYKYACYCDCTRPTWLGYYWQFIVYYWWIRVQWPLAIRECNKKGHNWDMTDMGGPENGPIIYMNCLRCGKATGPSYMN